jgi:Do/DeqQ family serine protease
MKRAILTITLAALLGSAVTLSVSQFVQKVRTVKIEQVSSFSAQNVSLKPGDKRNVIPLDFTDVAEAVMPSVVHIKSASKFPKQDRMFEYRQLPDPFRDFFNDKFNRDFYGPRFWHQAPRGNDESAIRIGTGSGVIINENGYIVTNNHVIDEADDIEITLDDNRVFKAEVIGTDPSTDLALLKIDAKNLKSIPLVDSDSSKVGEWVLAVGNPFNLNSTVTSGIISAKGRSLNILDDKSAIESFIQTDAAINQGNSGGALVNLQGGLVGICSAIASPTGSYAGYGFAVPSNIVKKVVEDLLEHGVVQRGVLGVMITGVDRNLAREKDLEVTSGVYVDSVLEKSAAGKAGVSVGDVIQEVDGKKVRTASELRELIARHDPGDKVRIKVDRSGEQKDFEVILTNPEEKSGKSRKELPPVLSTLRAEFKNADKKTCKRLGIEGGVEVTKLYPGALRMSGMREGFIITAVDGKPVESIEEFSKRVESKKQGGVMLEGVYEDAPGTYYYAFGI